MPNDHAKTKNLSIAAFLGFLALALIYLMLFPIRGYVNSLSPARTFIVSAEGKTTVTPDLASFSFSVVSEGNNPDNLARENNKKMNDVIAFVKSSGIEEKDIKTTQYSLSPWYEYDEKKRTSFISGYTLVQTVSIKTREISKNIDRMTKIISGLPGLGINQIGGISFEIEDPEKYLAEARAKAFVKAKEKAKAMTKESGVKLGRIITVSEYQGASPIFYKNALGINKAMESAPLAPAIQPGSEDVTVQVSITYELD